MIKQVSKAGMTAGITVLLVTAALAAPGPVRAQTDPASPSQPVAFIGSTGGPVTGAGLGPCPGAGGLVAPPLPQPPSSAQIQQSQTQFDQSLAQALNLSLATVLQAISSAQSSQTTLIPPLTPPQDPISAAAAQLGVSADQLRTAVQSADQTLCSAGTNLDATSFFSAVAQQLGQGLTGQQIQAAFVLTAPPLPDPSKLQTVMQQELTNLANALGVSTDALTAAFKSIAAAGGCLPPGTIGGVFITKSPDAASGEIAVTATGGAIAGGPGPVAFSAQGGAQGGALFSGAGQVMFTARTGGALGSGTGPIFIPLGPPQGAIPQPPDLSAGMGGLRPCGLVRP